MIVNNYFGVSVLLKLIKIIDIFNPRLMHEKMSGLEKLDEYSSRGKEKWFLDNF